jgi:hypothetical protein
VVVPSSGILLFTKLQKNIEIRNNYKKLSEKSFICLPAKISQNLLPLTMSHNNSIKFIMKTITTTSTRSARFCLNIDSSIIYCISGHLALHVNVKNKFGYPTQR